jgi:peptidoglycan/LPS O-acetylase OafA/YrhL
MLFFVVSGFCIHYPKVDATKFNLKTYAIRRALRIVPPYLAAVAFSLAVEWAGQRWLNLREPFLSSKETIWKTIFFVQNYPPSWGQLGSNPSLWSLPVEVELYVMYPLLFWVKRHMGGRPAFLIVVVISAAAFYLANTSAPWLAGNFTPYWIIWCAGAALAQGVGTGSLPRWRTWLWVPLLAAAGAALATRMSGGADILNQYFWAVTFFFLLWRCLSSQPPSVLLPRRLCAGLLWLGQISYSLYLIHFPFFLLAGAAWATWQGRKPTNLLVAFAAVLLVIPVAACFYQVIEKPFHHLARKWGKSEKR